MRSASVGLLSAGFLSAAMAAAASRPWGLGLLALVAYVPAFDAVLRTRRPLVGAAVAALASLGVASVGYEATMGIFPGAYFIALLVAAVPYALAGGLAVRFHSSALLGRLEPAWRVPATAFALTALWCAAELLPARPELFGVWAFPLGAIGYSQVDLPTAQLARFSSVTAVSAFVLAVNAALVALWRARVWAKRSQRPQGRPRWATLGTLVLLAGSVAGAAASAVTAEDTSGSAAGSAPGPSLTVRLVQPNLPDSVYVAAAEVPAVEGRLAARLAALSAGSPANFGPGATLTLLPEASWPGVVRPEEAATVSAALDGAGTVLFGAVSAGWDYGGSSGERYANSVMLLQNGELRHVYDKRRLVPIAEAPLRGGAITGLLEVGGVNVAPLICYDVVFPADVRAAARAGAELLVVTTDDSFAARSDVPALHLRVAVMRAIETGLPVALVSNTGPSAAIAAGGALLAITRPLEATVLTATLVAGAGSTPYVRYGDWVGAAAVALSLGIGAVGVAGGGAVELDQGPT